MTDFDCSRRAGTIFGGLGSEALARPILSRKQACLSSEHAVKSQVKLTSPSYTTLLQPKRDKAWRDLGRCRCGHCCVI